MKATQDHQQPRQLDPLTREQVEAYADAHAPPTWPVNAMPYYLSGVIAGIDLGIGIERAEIAFLQRWAVAGVHAAARFPEHTEWIATLHTRALDSCERQKREAVRWPEETVPADPGPWPGMRYLPFERPAP